MPEDVPGIVEHWIGQWFDMPENVRVTAVMFIILLTTATVALFARKSLNLIERRSRETRTLWDDALLAGIGKPLVAFVWLQGIYWAAELAYRYSEAEIFSANDLLLRFGFIWLLVWTLTGSIRQVENVLLAPERMNRPMDVTTITAVSKLVRVAIFITAILIVMQSLGYSISGVLAFGGIGGIAVGFAAKDLLDNFFGGVIVHLDRPFRVGDWIRSPDRQIEGTVEEIGWRMTTIRTFDKRPLYVPNSVFTTVAVENPSRMFNRRIYETIGVRYADVDAMTRIVEDIRSMLESHSEIDQNQTLIVNFVSFSESSLDIMVYTFTKTTDWVDFHGIKQNVLLEIGRIIESHGASIAFPTRTLQLDDPEALAEHMAAATSRVRTKPDESTGEAPKPTA